MKATRSNRKQQKPTKAQPDRRKQQEATKKQQESNKKQQKKQQETKEAVYVLYIFTFEISLSSFLCSGPPKSLSLCLPILKKLTKISEKSNFK